MVTQQGKVNRSREVTLCCAVLGTILEGREDRHQQPSLLVCKSCISEVIKCIFTGPIEKWIVSEVHLIHSLLAGNLTPIAHCHRGKVTSPQYCNISTFSFAFLFDSPSDKMSNVMTTYLVNQQQAKIPWPLVIKVIKVLITQQCPTLCDPGYCSPPDSSVHGILQARILEWVPISFSRGSSQSRD